jgi:hypothetical protein
MSYLDEISGGSYYLNAFNNLLKRRQMENAAQNQMVSSSRQMPQMMGEGGEQDFGQGREYASPSGPAALGLGPAQDRSAFRDTMREMPPALGYALGMIPGIGTAFSLAKVADYAMGKAAEARNAPANQQMSEARQGFRTREIADRNAAMQNTPQQAFRTSELSGMNAPMQNTPQQAFQTGEKSYTPTATAPPSNNFLASLLSGILPSSSVSLNPAPVEDREATPVGFSSPTSNFGKESNIPTGGIVSPGMNSSVSSGNDFGSFSGSFDSGGYEGGGYYNQGGMVKAQHLMGRAPAPDDGYGALQGGEYVITKAAVERYGKAMMDAINNGTFR